MAKAQTRRYPRLTTRMPVDYTIGDRSSHCVAETLSGGGLFLTQVDGLEPGNELSLKFRPAKNMPIIQAKASVRYNVAGLGTAVEFKEISSEDQQRLLRYIHQETGDRRLLPRAPLATQIECDKCMSLAFSRDVSLGGMFIETTDPLPVGSTLTVRFNLNEKDVVVTAAASVTYQLRRKGMGVLFTEVDPQGRDALREYVEKTLDLPPAESAKNQPG